MARSRRKRKESGSRDFHHAVGECRAYSKAWVPGPCGLPRRPLALRRAKNLRYLLLESLLKHAPGSTRTELPPDSRCASNYDESRSWRRPLLHWGWRALINQGHAAAPSRRGSSLRNIRNRTRRRTRMRAGKSSQAKRSPVRTARSRPVSPSQSSAADPASAWIGGTGPSGS